MMTTTERFDAASILGDRLDGLKEYAPETMDKMAERLGVPVGQLCKLDANENPYGPTQHTRDALAAYNAWHRYPDAKSTDLREAIGGYVGVDPETIMVGNGSDELIDVIVKLFRPDPSGGGIAQMIYCPPTFGMYTFYAATNDIDVVTIPRDEAYAVDVDAIETLCADERPHLVFLASPNNPDGQLLPDVDLDRLLALPLIVVLDEAYVEFSGGSRAKRVGEHDNLIVLRTFSKWAGLAGLRVGYGIFPMGLMDSLWRIKSPYNVNAVAQVAALATLESLDEAKESISKIVAERQRLYERLSALDVVEVAPTQANFLLCRVPGVPLGRVRAAMERRGVILRYYGAADAEGDLRISVGTPTQDDCLLAVFRDLAKEEA